MALTDNLLAFYKLSDTSDSSGNNRTLTNNGNVSFASGKIGNAAVFDEEKWLTINDLPATTGGPVSFSCWFHVQEYPTLWGYGAYREIFGFIREGFLLQAGPDGELGFYYSDVEGSWSGGEMGIAQYNTGWTHCVGCFDGVSAKLYVNGNLAYESPVNGFLFFKEDIVPAIGAQGNGIRFFNGSIDAVGIWNRALSDSEVSALYNSGNGLELDGGNGGGGGGNPTLVKMEAPIKFFGKVKFGV